MDPMRKQKLSQQFRKADRKPDMKKPPKSRAEMPKSHNSPPPLAIALMQLRLAMLSALKALFLNIDHVLTTKWPAWLDEWKAKQDAEAAATSHLRRGLSSEGWAGVMAPLGIALAFVMAWKNGLLR